MCAKPGHDVATFVKIGGRFKAARGGIGKREEEIASFLPKSESLLKLSSSFLKTKRGRKEASL
jgi:hypothetical protein